jgi:hypothetical protein
MQGGIAAAILAAFTIVALTVIAGCGSVGGQTNTQAKGAGLNPSVSTDAATGTSNEGTRVITNLSQLSSTPTTAPSLNAQNLVNGAASLHDDTAAASPLDAQSIADANLDHLYLSKQHSAVNGGEAPAAGDRTLLNAKAREFPEFSYAMLNQTLVAAQELEAQRLQDHPLPDDIKPIILVAVMTPEGKLTDLSIEQHTGVGDVDRLLIDACKKGLWAMNPPKAALAGDNTYRLRFEAVIRNHSYDVQGNYHYITHVGLALL